MIDITYECMSPNDSTFALAAFMRAPTCACLGRGFGGIHSCKSRATFCPWGMTNVYCRSCPCCWLLFVCLLSESILACKCRSRVSYVWISDETAKLCYGTIGYRYRLILRSSTRNKCAGTRLPFNKPTWTPTNPKPFGLKDSRDFACLMSLQLKLQKHLCQNGRYLHPISRNLPAKIFGAMHTTW